MQRSKTARVLNALRLKKAAKGDWDHSLPVEILEEIFALVLNNFENSRAPIMGRRKIVQPFLQSLARVCQVWYSVVTPMLYGEIYLSSSDALASLARAVTKYPHLQPLVHKFQYSSVIFKSARIEISQVDAWNIKRIYRACTNLHSLALQRLIENFPSSDEQILRAIGRDMASVQKLTRLEIELPHGMPCDSRLIFSSELTLPALQELIVENKTTAILPNAIYSDTHPEHHMEWPRMPKLSKLCIKNWHVRHACFKFPDHSDKLRTIELLGGNYSSINSFFYQDLRRYTSTLESLTITAGHIANERHHRVDFREYSSLSELCIPLSAFGRWSECIFPYNLQRLILAGCPEKGFDERDNFLLRDVEKKLGNLLELKVANRTLSNLKLVRVMVKSIWMWSRGPVIDFEKAIRAANIAGVKLTFGFLRAEENTFSENLKERLFDKFPTLERKLQ